MESKTHMPVDSFRQAVEAVIALIEEYDTVTFPEITARLAGIIPTEGDSWLSVPGAPHFILWQGMSQEYAQVMQTVAESRRVVVKPSTFWVYAYDGQILALPPIVPGTPKSVQTPHWLSICFRPSTAPLLQPAPTPRRPRQQAPKQRAPGRTGRQKSGYVYVMQTLGLTHVKIGSSRNPEGRRRMFATGNSLPLQILREIPSQDAARLERHPHRRYAAFHLHGDWFDLPADLVQQLREEPFD
jgi:Meiotically up-regulated gene 113